MGSCRNQDLSFLLLGVPAWSLVNATWGSLSRLAEYLPEGYSVSAYLLVALTAGNVAPLFLGGIVYSLSFKQLKKLIMSLLFIGFLTGLLMSLFWNSTITVDGTMFSIPLYLFFFMLGICSSSTSVTHFVLVSTFPASCTTYMTTGMGLGSMAAGILSLSQYLSPSRFSVGLYFFCVSLLYIPAILSLYYIENTDVAAPELGGRDKPGPACRATACPAK